MPRQKALNQTKSWIKVIDTVPPDLWPVQLSQKDLDFVMLTIVYVLRRETRQRPLILRARNFRFDKSDPVLGLTGRHVAVSLSVGSCIRPLHRLARQDAAPNGIEKSVNLGYACKLARRLGGAAEVKGLQTGRITSKTVVTTYIPQYVKILESAEFSATLSRLVTCARSRRARVR